MNKYEIGISVSNFEYKEPGVMKNTGIMYGLNGAMSTLLGRWYLAIEGNIEGGTVDYTSVNTGSSNGDTNFLAELRGLGGVELVGPSGNFSGRSWSLIPYTGVGYRYLNNDSAGRLTSTGHAGYDRESNYIYSPLGIQLTKFLGSGGIDNPEGWSVGAKGEYDFFWWGRQISHLSDADPFFSDLRNTQTKGYGYRASVFLKKSNPDWDLKIEPYFTYWNIKKSDTSTIYGGGTVWGYGWEPKNTTTEAGVRVSLGF
ncbi:MAG: hypothetical protein ACM3OC_00390 [Deltaproteobacteria bacterium]